MTAADLVKAVELARGVVVPGFEFDDRDAVLLARALLAEHELDAYCIDRGIVETKRHHRWFCGPLGFVLTDVRRCEPIAISGALGFWNVPDEIAARVEEQLR